MATTEQLKIFENNLSALVDVHYRDLANAVRLHLTLQEQAVFDFAMSKYAAGGRWYDKWGIPDSVFDTLFIVKQEQKLREIVLPILALHDTGYPTIADTAKYTGADMRELHMRVGARNAAMLYEFRNADDSFMFSRADVDKIATVVAHHDDHYLPGPAALFSDGTLLDLHRTFVDCDRSFIPNFVSTYKDYVSRYARPEHGSMTGTEFLAMRVAYFFKKDDPEVAEIGLDIPDVVFEQYKQKYEPCYLPATRKVIAAHLKARKAECDQGLFDFAASGVWTAFEVLAERYVRKSLDATQQQKSADVMRYG